MEDGCLEGPRGGVGVLYHRTRRAGVLGVNILESGRGFRSEYIRAGRGRVKSEYFRAGRGSV